MNGSPVKRETFGNAAFTNETSFDLIQDIKSKILDAE
jgi:hypothetical protein